MNRRSLAALIACALLSVPLAAHAKHGGGNGGGGGVAQVEGIISAIDTAATPPTVTISGVTLQVTAATKIEVNEAHAGLADLDVGARGEAKFDPTTLIASKIEQAGGAAGQPNNGEGTGVVVSADPVAGSLALDLNNDGAVDVTLDIVRATELKIGPAELAVADLALFEGLTVSVEFNPTTFVAREVKAASSAASTITGTVQAIDTANDTVTILPATGPALTVLIVADTEIEVKRGLKVGALVQVTGVASASGDQIALSIRSPKAVKQKNKNKGKGKGHGGGHGGGHDDPQPHH